MKRLTSVLLLLCVFCVSSVSAVLAQDEKRVLTLTTESEEAKAHFRQGLIDQENIFFERAASHYEQALEADPSFAMAEFMLAVAKPGLTNEERLEAMDDAIAGLADASAGEMLLALAWREDLRGEDDDAVRALFDAAIEMMPDDPHVALRRAFATEATYSPGALLALTEVVERFPEQAGAYNMLAYNRWHLGDRAGAMEAVQKYVELMPDHPNPHDSYAELLQFRGLYDEATKHYQKAVELDPNYYAGHIGLADVAVLQGDHEAARRYLAQARKAAPSESQVHGLARHEAMTYFHAGDLETGLAKLRAAAEAAEKAGQKAQAAHSYRALAVAEAVAGDHARMKAALSKAAELGGADTAVHHAWTAYAHAVAGDAAAAHKAASAYDKATGGDRNWGPTLHGLAFMAEGKLNDAEKQLILSGTENVVSKAAMAELQRKLGRTAEAEFYERDVISDNTLGVADTPYALTRLRVKRM